MAGKKENQSNEIKITRIYDAPVKVVWQAWTDPAQVAQWWGPRGFTITTHSKNLKPGGIWHYTMHGPDGKDWPNKTLYHEVEECARLVYDHGATDETDPLFRVTVLFSEVKGKTKMDMTMTLPTPEQAEQTRKFIKQAGGDATWDRLAEYLGKETQNKDKFVINRSFDAPLDLMFKMWTDPEHVSNWSSPTGFRMEYINVDIRPGGSSFYLMTNDADVTMYGGVNYLEVQKPNRIVYTQHFADKDGNLSRHPMAPTWPAHMLTVVTLAEEAPNKTRVTIEWEPHGDFTSEELEMFIKAKPGMTQGWTGSLDKLEDHLKGA